MKAMLLSCITMLLYVLLDSYQAECKSLRIPKRRRYMGEQFPYIVYYRLKGYGGNNNSWVYSYSCSGIALKPSWTLSAGHCFNGFISTRWPNGKNNMMKLQKLGFEWKERSTVIKYYTHRVHTYKLDYYDIINVVKFPSKRDTHLTFEDITLLQTETIQLDKYGKLSAVDFTALSGQKAIMVRKSRDLDDFIPGMTGAWDKSFTFTSVLIKRCDNNQNAIFPTICTVPACGIFSTLCDDDGGLPLIYLSGIVGIASRIEWFQCVAGNLKHGYKNAGYYTSDCTESSVCKYDSHLSGFPCSCDTWSVKRSVYLVIMGMAIGVAYGCFNESECGVTISGSEVLITGGRPARRGEVPWHAGIYRKSSTNYTQICGGSLISQSVIISAAHCFWNGEELQPAPGEFAVTVGKLYRRWQSIVKLEEDQKSDVKEIHFPDHYQGSDGNYQEDLAVIVVTTPFQYTQYVRPVCVNFDVQLEKRQLQTGSYGKVAGWGLTETGPSSQVLRLTELPFIDIRTCIMESPFTFRPHITGDKICAGFKDSNVAVCKGDSGGGLVFPLYENGTTRYYLRGVVSSAPRTEQRCNTNDYTTFTQLLKHEHFVKQFLYLDYPCNEIAVGDVGAEIRCQNNTSVVFINGDKVQPSESPSVTISTEPPKLPNKCNAAVLSCCPNSNGTNWKQCFDKYGCSASYASGNACTPSSIQNALEAFRAAYSP